MRPKNKYITSPDLQYLKDLQEEYRKYGDWDTELNGNTLTVFALHRKYQRRKDKAAQAKRNKREERFAKKKYQKDER